MPLQTIKLKEANSPGGLNPVDGSFPCTFLKANALPFVSLTQTRAVCIMSKKSTQTYATPKAGAPLPKSNAPYLTKSWSFQAAHQQPSQLESGSACRGSCLPRSGRAFDPLGNPSRPREPRERGECSVSLTPWLPGPCPEKQRQSSQPRERFQSPYLLPGYNNN